MAYSFGMLNGINVRLLPMFPLSVVLGGLELQCIKTHKALREIGASAELLNYYDPKDKLDLLHLFGSSPNFYDICQQMSGRGPFVISTVSSARNASRVRAYIWQGVSGLARAARLQTTYERLHFIYNIASAVICLNTLEAEFLQRTYDVPLDRIKIITNGVDDHYFGTSGDYFREKYKVNDFVLYTGNIVRRKNPLLLAKVLRNLDYQGVFIGGTLPAEKVYADDFAAFIDNSPNLLWLPPLKHDDPLLASAYAAANVFCLPSTGETQSLSALEAMATGIPVILGDAPYAHQSPFEHSLKCVPDDQSSVSRCLEQALNHPETFVTALPDSYRWKNVAHSIVNVYREVLARYKSVRP